MGYTDLSLYSACLVHIQTHCYNNVYIASVPVLFSDEEEVNAIWTKRSQF